MRAISTRAASSISGDRRSSGPAIRISSSRASWPTSARGALPKIDQNPVEQIDMVGPQVRSPLQEQLGDPARGLGKAAGIALPEDLIEPGDERGSNRHEHYSTRRNDGL
jgi:hypothetical protein